MFLRKCAPSRFSLCYINASLFCQNILCNMSGPLHESILDGYPNVSGIGSGMLSRVIKAFWGKLDNITQILRALLLHKSIYQNFGMQWHHRITEGNSVGIE